MHKIKNIITILKWGMRNHPGNGMYLGILITSIALVLTGNGSTVNQIARSISLLSVLLLLYLWTSYCVGSANSRQVTTDNKQESAESCSSKPCAHFLSQQTCFWGRAVYCGTRPCMSIPKHLRVWKPNT